MPGMRVSSKSWGAPRIGESSSEASDRKVSGLFHFGASVDEKRAKVAFDRQKHGAGRREIAWEITFDEWMKWWGSDLDRRGSGPDDLQMQRPGDSGPYRLGNIHKGTPRENSITAGAVKRNLASEKAKRDHQTYLDALMWGASKENHRDDEIDPNAIEIARLTGNLHVPNFNGAAFVRDKRR